MYFDKTDGTLLTSMEQGSRTLKDLMAPANTDLLNKLYHVSSNNCHLPEYPLKKSEEFHMRCFHYLEHLTTA